MFRRCKHTSDQIAQSLAGNYRAEHVFALAQALALYESYQTQLALCDKQIEQYLRKIRGSHRCKAANALRERNKNEPAFDIQSHLFRITEVDLTRIDGIAAPTALTVISEIGADMSRWVTVKYFTSWLGLCPGTKITGGKVQSSKTKPTASSCCHSVAFSSGSVISK